MFISYYFFLFFFFFQAEDGIRDLTVTGVQTCALPISVLMEARAIQRTVRQSARKMRLVVDLIRGRPVPEAYAILRYSKKLAAKHIHKVLKSAVANAQQAAQRQNAAFDADRLLVKYAVVNEGSTLKRFTSAAMGR